MWLVLGAIGALVTLVVGNPSIEKYSQRKPCCLNSKEGWSNCYYFTSWKDKDKYLKVLSLEEEPETWDINVGFFSEHQKIQVVDTVYNNRLIEFGYLVRRHPLSNDTTTEIEFAWIKPELVDCGCSN